MKHLTTIAFILLAMIAKAQPPNFCIVRTDTFMAKILVQHKDSSKPYVELGYKIQSYMDCDQTGRHSYKTIALLDRKKKRFSKNYIYVDAGKCN